ncbi:MULTISPECIES: DUF6457 domain-containing protein [Microcella]|uniref:DUF6457 domain-containing protein n=1 Tax=Microcella TaxID=337004 RepID=UPI001CD160EA|nr:MULTISPECIES: DUF6457 domain-containing protein [Microcella]
MTDDRDALLADWVDELCAALGLEQPPADIDTVLALAGRVAHGVVRPAAPLATFLAGYAAGRRAGSEDAALTPGTGAGIDPELATIDRLLAERGAASNEEGAS